MNTQAPTWILIGAAALALALPAAAQAPAPARSASAARHAATPASAAASRPSVMLPERNPPTAAEKSQAAMNPDDVRPYGSETQAVPQVRIPFGKAPPQPEGTAQPKGGGVNDAYARCNAVRGGQARVKCREEARLDARNEEMKR